MIRRGHVQAHLLARIQGWYRAGIQPLVQLGVTQGVIPVVWMAAPAAVARIALDFSGLLPIYSLRTSAVMRGRKQRGERTPPRKQSVESGEKGDATFESGRFFAHSKQHADGSPAPLNEWEPLFTPFDDTSSTACRKTACPRCERLEPHHGHLNKVAWWTAKFAGEMFVDGPDREAARQWGFIAGLWHDLGKFSDEFQERLRGKRPKANHSTAGAQLAVEQFGPIGCIFAYLIAGHHAGLSDFGNNNSNSDLIRSRREVDYLGKLRESPKTTAVIDQLLGVKELPPCPVAPKTHSIAFFVRFLFSCLVDADYLATEAFMDRERFNCRPDWKCGSLKRMQRALNDWIARFPQRIDEPILTARRSVLENCQKAADRDPGLFTLTVPTGGGKTLSSLSFAIKHAIRNNLRRIVYVIPFTSIIEQNADEFRRTFEAVSRELGQDVVLEHHSNFDPVDEGPDDGKSVFRLAAENWDAPLIVTTNVQFFESLAHHKTSRCRKLHNLARSVIILDEAQSLPPQHLHPCLDFLKQLQRIFKSTVVLCTATQPALGKLPSDTPGNFAESFNRIALELRPENEIIQDVPRLFSLFKRATINREPEPLTDADLAERLLRHDRVLCILNTKPHATKVFEMIGADNADNFHLSAQLAPAHRRAVLAEIRRREDNEGDARPCRLIATTVVEAGVDISFPTLYRAYTGLDSFAQAVGRCNRHGKLSADEASVFFFTPADCKTPRFLIFAVQATNSVLPDYAPSDLLSPGAIEKYFRQAYWQQGGSNGNGWDGADYRRNFQLQDRSNTPFLFNFKSFSTDFRLIPDIQAPVIIEPKEKYMPGLDESLYDDLPSLLEQIRDADRKGYTPPFEAHQRLQQITVQIPKSVHADMIRREEIQSLCDNRFPVLTHPENLYHPKLGLQLPEQAKLKFDAFYV